jgi:orsellinic acid C2-O-methyltransferase
MVQSPLLDMVFGYMPAQVLFAAAELRVADHLAGGQRTSEELAEQTQAHAPSLRRLLRALAGLGVVTQTGPDAFQLTELGAQLRADAPDSVRGLVLLLCGPEIWRSWAELASSVRTGETGWDRAHGTPVFEFFEQHPEQSATFNLAMAQHTRDAAPGIIAAYDFSRFAAVMDVGGGDGTLLAEILRTQPHLKGMLFDLPSGLAGAATTLAVAGVADRCRVVPGDFFVSVPEGADAYVMKFILHDWDDDRAVAILRNCRRAMAPGGRLLILERVLPEVVTTEVAETLLVDLTMLITNGGTERTEEQFRGLLTAAGFTLTAITDPLPLDYRVIEAAPA